jgi:peroxiredoxin
VYVRVNFESVNISRPAEFILDREKIVRYIFVGRIQTEFAGDEEILAVLDSLTG